LSFQSERGKILGKSRVWWGEPFRHEARTKGGSKVGNTDEREGMSEEREATTTTTSDVEGHGMSEGPTEGLSERASDETDDVEAHGLIGAPTDAPTEAPTD
jgi:hypothetical protein